MDRCRSSIIIWLCALSNCDRNSSVNNGTAACFRFKRFQLFVLYRKIILEQQFSACGPQTTGGPRTSAWWSAGKGYFLLFKGYIHKRTNFDNFPWHNFRWWSATDRPNL